MNAKSVAFHQHPPVGFDHREKLAKLPGRQTREGRFVWILEPVLPSRMKFDRASAGNRVITNGTR